MKRRSNGIGNYKRKLSPSGVTRTSDESWARMEASDRAAREKAAGVYNAEKAGRSQEAGQRVEAAA